MYLSYEDTKLFGLDLFVYKPLITAAWMPLYISHNVLIIEMLLIMAQAKLLNSTVM